MTVGFYSYSGGIKRIIDGNSESLGVFATGTSVAAFAGGGGTWVHRVTKSQFGGVMPLNFYVEFTPTVSWCFKLAGPVTTEVYIQFLSSSQFVKWLAVGPMRVCPLDGSQYGMVIKNSSGVISYDSRRRPVEIRDALYFDIEAGTGGRAEVSRLSDADYGPIAVSADANFVQLGCRGMTYLGDYGVYGAWWQRLSATTAKFGIPNADSYIEDPFATVAWSNWDGYAKASILTLKANV